MLSPYVQTAHNGPYYKEISLMTVFGSRWRRDRERERAGKGGGGGEEGREGGGGGKREEGREI